MPYKQKNGTWRATKMIQGSRRAKVFNTKAEALKWEARQDASEWSGLESQTVTVYSLAQAYLDYAKDRFVLKTYQEKALAFRNLLRFVKPDCPADSIPDQDIRKALAHRAKASGNAANKDRKNLAAAWEWGKELHRWTKQNPFSVIKKWKHDSGRRYVPSEEDFWKAFNAAAPEDMAFLLLMLHTGARRGELYRLQWSDVDLDQGKIRLGTRKTGHGGLVYHWLRLTTPAMGALQEQRKRMRSMFVFSLPDGQPFRYRNKYMERLCRRAGVKAFGFHAIRHLSASILAREGVDIPTIQGILRHQSPTTTARYLRRLGAVDDTLENVFGKKFAPGAANAEGNSENLLPRVLPLATG
jgi:integrase